MEEQVGSHGWDVVLQGREEFQTNVIIKGAENELMFLSPSIIFAQLAEGRHGSSHPVNCEVSVECRGDPATFSTGMMSALEEYLAVCIVARTAPSL